MEESDSPHPAFGHLLPIRCGEGNRGVEGKVFAPLEFFCGDFIRVHQCSSVVEKDFVTVIEREGRMTP